MINAKRLSKIIQERESKNVLDNLVLMYGRLTVQERISIKTMLNRNKQSPIIVSKPC